MLDIVDFWKKQVDLWNEQNKCGLCFELAAPLVTSQLNIVQEEKPCCVQVFLTDIRFREIKNRNSVTGLITSKTCVWNFSLYVVKKVPLGLNNYNEVKGHPVDESKWVTLFQPLIECLGCDNILNTCEILGLTNMNVDMPSDATLIHNYLDDNYNGWKINYSFTQIT